MTSLARHIMVKIAKAGALVARAESNDAMLSRSTANSELTGYMLSEIVHRFTDYF